jgi:hypothetical protein
MGERGRGNEIERERERGGAGGRDGVRGGMEGVKE